MKTPTLSFAIIYAAAALFAQTDPGPRNLPPQPPRPIRGVSPAEQQAFMQGLNTFTEIDNVANGLGPRFNLDSCAGCHAQPSVGGSSPRTNPQIQVAHKFGAANQIPPFIQPNGPAMAVRFRQNSNGTPDGGVHNLFVITGRSDASPSCQITQPDFSNTANLSFRIPTPLFGLGLIEAIPDATLTSNLAATAAQRQSLGIGGQFNSSANDGTITRFGWKAQNKSPLMFAGEAYNVEIGVTNDLFPQERDGTAACASGLGEPEDHANLVTNTPSDIDLFTLFMRYLAPPAPPPPPSQGSALFASVGCALCHTPQLTTGNSESAALAQQPVSLFSDLAVHHMGQTLNDGITQGSAQGDQFRTAPLWGLGDRIFLLHDGRTPDLVQAIQLHASPGSEANAVIANYMALAPQQKQAILNFLRSL
jgi:CxxC motif-containing protein (DUF1111 family)